MLLGRGPHAGRAGRRTTGAKGYVDNFAWGELEIGAGNVITLADGNSTPGGGFYADVVAGAIHNGVVTNIDGAPGLDIYYNRRSPETPISATRPTPWPAAACSPRALRPFPSPRPGR